MSKVGRWSTTAANNNATPPDGWPEGQAPSTVNDCARENMAAIKTAMQDMDFFDHDFTPTFINANSFSVPGDQTARIVAGRQLKLYDATTHIRDVGSASFTTVTTISLGAGTALTSSLSSFAVSIINPNSSALPNSFNRFSASAIEITATLTASSAAILANLGVAGYISASAGQVTGVLSTSSIVATGPVTLGTTLSVSGAAVVKGALSVGGILTVANNITFPAVQVTSGDANTLDDYEEGTFTPTIVGVTTAGVGTYNTQFGRYTKIGNRVLFNIFLDWTAHTGTGAMRVSGLPFVSDGTANSQTAVAPSFPSNIVLAANSVLVMHIEVGLTEISFLQYSAGGGAVATVSIDAAGAIIAAGQYSI